MPDDDDRPRDASSAADPAWSDAAHASAGWPDAVVVPDDISELADDVAAYHREQRTIRRREFIQRHAASNAGRPLVLTLAALAVVVVFATFLTVFAPSANRPGPLPLAKSPSSVGQQGGLLPAASLRLVGRTPVSSRSLRPAVLAVIPAGYSDPTLLRILAKDASAAKLALAVVAPDASAAALDGQIDSGATRVYLDANNQLATGVNATGVTVVLVNRDGTIFRILRNVGTDTTSQVTMLGQQMLHRTGG